MKDKYDALKLENQLCFPLYACSKEIVRRYKPYLDEIDLTYTQYIAMMVLWERGRINVKDMGALLYLDSGTLTPVLKKLEQKGYLTRERDRADERVLNVTVTEAGEQLKEQVAYYMRNAKVIYEGLKEIGCEVYGGVNAPYIWLLVPGGMTSWEFFDYLLDKAGVVGTPGSGFGPSGEGYFRLTAFGTYENSVAALERIKAL